MIIVTGCEKEDITMFIVTSGSIIQNRRGNSKERKRGYYKAAPQNKRQHMLVLIITDKLWILSQPYGSMQQT